MSSRERRPSAERPPDLAYADIKPVFARLGDLTEQTRYPQMQRELAVRRARRRATALEGFQREPAARIGEAEIERQLRDSVESVRAGRKPKKPERG